MMMLCDLLKKNLHDIDRASGIRGPKNAKENTTLCCVVGMVPYCVPTIHKAPRTTAHRLHQPDIWGLTKGMV
jgi:hypothetical protein